MKSSMLFFKEVLNDLGTWCCTSTLRDYKTVADRVKDEGFSFLTITLTNFGKDFEKSLDQGFVGPSAFAGFARKGGGLPLFLGGFLGQVFDPRTGRLLENPSIEAIRAVRQITLLWGKVNLPCSDARREAAFEAFVKSEESVRLADARQDAILMADYHRISRMLFARAFNRINQMVYDGSLKPKHGPGATADRLRGNSKWRQYEWTERLERVFPARENLVPNDRYEEYLSHVRILEPGAERPVRVIAVPKTLKTPRIIAIEPTCMQYVQQGLLAAIWDEIEGCSTLNSLIGWASAMPNQRLAMEGSRNGALATLDLREASDRVSNQHVRLMLANHSSLRDAVDACRSRKADVPGHGVIRLAKFASMGSALTFPFESMHFLVCVLLGIEKSRNRQLTYGDTKSLIGSVRIYGDDIICPVEYVPSVIEMLQAFGAEVNSSKSFWTGKFRESCGKEYYAGEDVTIARVRKELPVNGRQSAEIVSAIELRNNLYSRGLWKSAAWLDRYLESLKIPMPMVLESSPIHGRISVFGYEIESWDKDLQTPQVRGVVDAPKIPSSELDGLGALTKVLVTAGSLPTPDPRHLHFAGRPRIANTKTRCATPY